MAISFRVNIVEPIDKADIASISRLTYPHGLLGSKVKRRYNRAESVLQNRYGKESEVLKAYLTPDLPVITSAIR